MSEQEIKEQIERDAENRFQELGFVGSETRARIDGATAQDKIATNRTVEAAIAIVKEYATIYDEAIIIKELEKLRR